MTTVTDKTQIEMLLEDFSRQYTQDDKAQELQRLVEGTQRNEPEATEQLCLTFRPLIQARSRAYIYNSALREDAENCAWEIFLRYVKRYDGSDYKRLPGLLDSVIRFGLHKNAQRLSYYDPHIDVSQDIGDLKTIAAQEDNYAHVNADLEKHLAMLTPRQRQIIQLVCLDGKTMRDASAILHIPFATLRYQLEISKAKISASFTALANS